MSLRIAYISSTFPDYKSCGTGIYAGYLTKSLAELNHDVHVITTALPEIKNTYGKVTMHKIMSSWGMLEAPRLIQKLIQIKPDIVHINHPTQIAGAKSKFLINLFPEMNQAMGRFPVVTTIHEFVNNSFLGKIKVLPLMASSDVVTVTNEFYKEKLKKYLSESMMKKIEVVDVGNNFDPVFETLPENKEAQRKKWGLNSQDKVIGFTGFISPPKGFEILISIFSKLASKDTRYKILALSSWNLTDPVYKNKLLQQIEKSGLKDRIVFSGFLSDEELWQAMGAIDLCVFPFKYPLEERSSGVFRQAIGRGLPTMTFAKDLGYNEFGIKHMENIWLVPHLDEEVLVQSVESFFSKPEISKKLSLGAKALRKNFSFEVIANQMSRIYSRLA